MSKEKTIDSVLGQKVDSPSTYTPGILVREKRQGNRTYLGLHDDHLPFVGYDIWNGYECSALTDNGLPVSFIAKVVYPANSKYIVESKSMKLYWNSFNMWKCGNSSKAVLKYIKETTEIDLSDLLETNVKVGLFSQIPTLDDPLREEWNSNYVYDWIVLEDNPGLKNIEFTRFNENPDILISEPAQSLYVNGTEGVGKFTSALLRSNCKITHQPDSGSVFVYYKSKKTITQISLLEYIVSMRNEAHFHEEILECIYKRLWDILQPSELLVTCFYARRGGWDINPTRSSHKNLLDKNLINPKKYFIKLPSQ